VGKVPLLLCATHRDLPAWQTGIRVLSMPPGGGSERHAARDLPLRLPCDLREFLYEGRKLRVPIPCYSLGGLGKVDQQAQIVGDIGVKRLRVVVSRGDPFAFSQQLR